MKKLKWSALLLLSTVFIFGGCATWNKTQKGAAVGTAAGGATGAVIGRAAGNTALGAIIGAAVGGASGAVIGRQMDKQAEEIKSKVPDAKVERVGEGIVVEFSSNVLFGFDEADLSAEAKANLNKLVTVLNTYPETDIEIQGHTDSKGSESYNQKLSKKRDDKVSDHLANQGLANNRLNNQGCGETMPKYSNDDNEGRMRNRRVEFLITANETMKVHAEKVSSN